MLDITIKTIDGQNRSYSIPDEYTIRQFKDKIANSLNIPIERQRLIFQGRELKDERLIREFDVNGKTVHLVQRAPPQQPTQINQQPQVNESTSTPGNHRPRVHTEETNIYINASGAPPDMQGIFQQIFSGLGDLTGANIATSTSNITPNNATQSPSASSMDIQIDLGNVTNQTNEQEIRSRIRNMRRLLTQAESRLNRLQEIQSGAPLNDLIGNQIVIQASRTIPYIPGIGPITLPQDTITSVNITQTDAAVTSTNANSNQQSQNTNNSEQQQQQQSQNIRLEVLGDVLQSTMNVYQRFLPYLQDYNRLLVEDCVESAESESNGNRRQRFCNNINDMLHLMGHLFHNLSDLHVNLRDAPPRNMRTMVPMQAAVVSVPFAATFQVPLTPASTSGSNQPPAPTQVSNESSNQTSQQQSPSVSSSLFSNVQSLANYFLSRGQPQASTNPPDTSNLSSDDSSSSDSSPPPLEQINPNSNNNNVTNETRSTASNMFHHAGSLPPQQLTSMDPYLACSSVHLLTSNLLAGAVIPPLADAPHQTRLTRSSTQQRRRHPAGNQTNNATTVLPETQADLNRFFGDLLAMNRPQVPTNITQNRTSIVFANITTRPTSTSAITSTNAQPQQLQQESTITSQRQEKTIKNDILNLLESNDHNDKRLSEKIESLFKLEVSSSRNKFWQVVNFAIGKLKLRDLIELSEESCDYSKLFHELRKPLEVHIQKNIINYENFNSYFNDLISEFINSIDVQKFLRDDDHLSNCDLDFKNSLENILKYHIRILTNHVLDDDHVQWSSTFHKYLRACRDHLIILFKKCFNSPISLLKKLMAHCFVTNQIVGDVKLDRFLKEYLVDLFENILTADKFEETNMRELVAFKNSKIKSEKREAENQSVVLTSGNTWESLVPSEWTPIIQNDIERQFHSQPGQAPFSDAYLCGLPAKRRRILSKLDLKIPSIFESVMQSTLAQIKSKKNASNDQILEHACGDYQLTGAFETSFDLACLNRLKNDSDFKDIVQNQQQQEADETNNDEMRLQYSQKRLQ